MYYGFRPYVSVAKRRAQALKEVEKRRKKGDKVSPVVIEGRNIANTFWGKAWCENLESYSDFANRLPRGRTYARNGSVVDLQIRPGQITALVSGSSLYKINITITPVADVTWQNIKSRCAGQIGSLVELLQGKLSKEVMDIVTAHEGGLFPKPREIKMSCSCPDYAGLCKHLAAVMYGIGARLDHEPQLLFSLRKVDHLELIESAVPATVNKTGSGKKQLVSGDVADVFGIELAEPETAEPAVKPAPKSKKINAGNLAKTIVKKPAAKKPAKGKAKVSRPR